MSDLIWFHHCKYVLICELRQSQQVVSCFGLSTWELVQGDWPVNSSYKHDDTDKHRAGQIMKTFEESVFSSVSRVSPLFQILAKLQ